jgi:hypothetical protein
MGALREFFAPLPLLAVAVLAVNDHLLKGRAPPLLTGKLSDAAVCFLLPLYLSALVGLVWRRRPLARLTVASLVTAALFAALELSDGAVALFCRANDAALGVLGFTRRCSMVRDLWDLTMLVFVPLAWLYGRARVQARA